MAQSATYFQCKTLDVTKSFLFHVYLQYLFVTDIVQVVANKEICGQRLPMTGKPVNGQIENSLNIKYSIKTKQYPVMSRQLHVQGPKSLINFPQKLH